ncbi:MAG: TlpA family protein disulfide reductase [Planctomycetia bacterium]|nr:TlpA family protein disulfide reductase [Planctomycetia bacterium]
MVATIWLLGCILVPAQPARSESADWTLAPRFERGVELVYRGSFAEQAAGDKVRFQRVFRFETRFLVLEASASGYELAGMTLLQDKASPRSPGAVRMEKFALSPNGRIKPTIGVPVEGPPSLEVGMFVELPSGKLSVHQGWETRETGEPSRAWTIAGSEMVLAQNCVKLVSIQVSDTWERPRADRGAWRRIDTLWINSRSGTTIRVERTIEQREPASRDTSRMTTLRYDLESSLKHLAPLISDRRNEISRALEFRNQANPLLPQPLKSSRELAALGRRINAYVDTQPATPYREAVLSVKRHVEAACKGEVVEVGYQEVPREEPTAAVGSLAPDFLATDITGPGSSRLSRFKGKPILMIFYQPRSETAPELLRWAQGINFSLGRYVNVVGMSASDDKADVLRQRSAVGATFPVLHGGGLRRTYGVEATPKMIIIDADGIIRGSFLGWGRETGDVVLAELRRWLATR